MSEQGGNRPNVGDILVGTFVILFGACLLLAGGACTALWVTWTIPSGSSSGPGGLGVVMLLVSLGVAALGLFCLYHGVRIARSQYRRPPPSPAERTVDKPGDA